jgi:succinate dehydrogenase / fumarate reductase, iron-sulfur subunit
MNGYITASVFRFNPEKDSQPYYQEYQVKTDEEMSVLVLLKHIQEEMDETLSFRSYCCGLQMCRSCLMKINKSKRFACLTLTKPGDKVTLEPLTFPESHIKDLVVKLSEKDQ